MGLKKNEFIEKLKELGLVALVNLPAVSTGDPFFGIIAPLATTVINKNFSKNMNDEEISKLKFATTYILEEIAYRLEKNDEIRSDGFFEGTDVNRSSAEQIFQGTLNKCKNEFIDKKVRIISNIFVNAVFNDEASLVELENILNVVEKLTYQQICLLSIFARKEEFTEYEMRKGDISDGSWRTAGAGFPESPIILQQISDLIGMGALAMMDVEVPAFSSIKLWNEIIPDMIKVTPNGYKYIKMLNLYTIEKSELEEVIKYLI
ncbi:hypothetical protein [Bacillus sp. AFS088145]|uniref:hypothetical protein n=1 Tax=Bacillus sp. AFS088145 TaxID=2033514 RepID=UPI000BF54B8F|nr:hypothetical protein [Bacillus sp. AFS088145]PFH86467.1 hypothetical protein COI44_12670 [Bacillus sp. AFS088145]